MTTALDRLERRGYVARVHDPRDRRRINVRLTERARRLVEAIWGPLGREGVGRLEPYTDEELRLIERFLTDGRELQERHAERVRSMGKAV
jgi:DNA-binding MarR family transcriptional regulator